MHQSHPSQCTPELLMAFISAYLIVVESLTTKWLCWTKILSYGDIKVFISCVIYS